jgi:predicted kinase
MSNDEWTAALGIDIRDAESRATIETLQCDQAMRLLDLGATVVIETGGWARSERDRLRAEAHSVGAMVHLDFLDGTIDVRWERLRGSAQRAGAPEITRDELVAWSATIERPTADELATYDPMPPVRAGDRPGSPAFPYGSWTTQMRPR